MARMLWIKKSKIRHEKSENSDYFGDLNYLCVISAEQMKDNAPWAPDSSARMGKCRRWIGLVQQ